MEHIKKKLYTPLSKEAKDRSRQKKDHNIRAFSELPKNRLSFGRTERRVFMGTTSAGEKIYIQYPGKESARQDDKVRPWDLRPKVQLPDEKFIGDLSFKDIWNDLITLHEKDPEILPVVATMLYRLSMLMDHEIVYEGYEYLDIDMSDKSERVKERGTIHLEHYRYSPDKEVIAFLSDRIGEIGGMSFEAYMLINDYLAQNEDCKYYYRDVVQKKGRWDGKIGRNNNLLTHIMIIAFLEKKVRFTDVTDQFQRMRGVAPIPEKLLPEVSDGLISETKGTIRL